MTTCKRLLDLFCGGGGAGMGYYRAGFDVVGVDIKPQKHYPFPFVLMDVIQALEVLLSGKYITDNFGNKWYLSDFDAIHESPPCQFGSEATPLAYRPHHKNYIPETRQALQKTRKPYIIENVENVRCWLENPIMLCGSMFGLSIWRHRYFEISPIWLMSPSTCRHDYRPITIHSGSNTCKSGSRTTANQAQIAMGTDWMSRDEVYQAIPPAYTEWIGQQLMKSLGWGD